MAVSISPSESYLVVAKGVAADLEALHGLRFHNFAALQRSIVGACSRADVVEGSEVVRREVDFLVQATVHGEEVILSCTDTGERSPRGNMPVVRINGVIEPGRVNELTEYVDE